MDGCTCRKLDPNIAPGALEYSGAARNDLGQPHCLSSLIPDERKRFVTSVANVDVWIFVAAFVPIFLHCNLLTRQAKDRLHELLDQAHSADGAATMSASGAMERSNPSTSL
jgi:hypothetical protein